MSTTYGYLDQLIDEKYPNTIENWWVKYLLWLHKEGRMPHAFLPKKLKLILWKWEDEMEVEHEQRY